MGAPRFAPVHQACPRRIHEPGPWSHTLSPIDRWRTTEEHWGTKSCLCGKRYGPDEPPEGTRLPVDNCPVHGEIPPPYPNGQVRTCSHCGSVHPEDALSLVQDGHHVEFAKGYKLYIVPDEGPRYVPPIKAYSPHFTEEQWRGLRTSRAFRPVGSARTLQ